MARQVGSIGRIQSRQRRSVFNLAQDPGFQPLLLASDRHHLFEERCRYDHGTVAIGDDNIFGKDGNATAADRLLPRNEGETRQRWRRRRTPAPHR